MPSEMLYNVYPVYQIKYYIGNYEVITLKSQPQSEDTHKEAHRKLKLQLKIKDKWPINRR